MKKYWYTENVLLAENEYDTIIETWKTTDDLEVKIPEGTRVLFTHKYFGHVTVENVTEVHFNYRKGRVAIESDIDHTGQTLKLEDVTALWFNA